MKDVSENFASNTVTVRQYAHWQRRGIKRHPEVPIAGQGLSNEKFVSHRQQ